MLKIYYFVKQIQVFNYIHILQLFKTFNSNLPNRMKIDKPRVIKDYNKLDKELQQQIKLVYADGFAENLIHFFDKNGLKITVLPFETEDKYYMLRMTENEAVQIVDEDDDFDEDGFLKNEVKQDYEDKYADMDHIADQMADDDDDIPDDDDDDDGGDDDDD